MTEIRTARAASSWAPRGAGNCWWLGAVAGSMLGVLALATCLGLITPPPSAPRAADDGGGASAATSPATESLERAESVAERAAESPQGAPRGADARAARPGSERWHVKRLRELAAADPESFRRDARERFDAAGSSEQFAFLRVALASDAPLADELGRALLAQGRRGDDDRFAAAVALLRKEAARANDAAQSLLATLTVEESARFAGKRRGDAEGADAH